MRDDNLKRLDHIKKLLFGARRAVRLLTEDSKLVSGGSYLSALETVKGFEFGAMVIIRCSKGCIPDAETPEDEIWRDARRLYVAMTRGRDEVLFTFNGKPSEFLEGMGQFVAWSSVQEQGLLQE